MKAGSELLRISIVAASIFLPWGAVLRSQVPVSGELGVSAPLLLGLEDPEVGVTRDGSFLVAWRDGSSGRSLVSARFFDSLGEPTSAPFYVEADPTSPTYDASPVISSDERTAGSRVAWTSHSGVDGVLRLRSRRVSAGGILEESELVVEGIGSAYLPALDLSGTSRWTLAWVSANFQTNGSEVYSQEYDGNSPIGLPMRMHAASYGLFSFPRVATDPLGNSIVAWEADPVNASENRVRMQRLSRDGEKVGPELGVPVGEAYEQYICDVGMDSQGRFAVAWSQGDPMEEGSSNVYAQRFGADGVPLGNSFLVPTDNAGAQYDCDLSMNREGDFVVVWKHYLGTDEDYYDLYVRAYRSDGSPYGDPVRVDEPRDLEIPWAADRPSISLNDAGVFVIVWEGGRFDRAEKQIFARKFVLPCSGAPTSLCLGDGRFRLHADWWVGEERSGEGRAFPLRDETGGFWFFAEDNPELVVKVLDGCGTNGHRWIYAAGLTDVEVHLSVTDTESGQIWSRVNPWRQAFVALQDIEALDGCPAATAGATAVASGRLGEPKLPRLAAGPEPRSFSGCVADATTLCLAGGRFEVRATYRAGGSTPSAANAEALTATSGLFWFFSPDNLELFVKSIDACGEFDRFWIFAAGLTNLEVDLVVRDRWADQTVSYPNPLGTAFELVRDTASFATCSAED